jgi:hypothetical protein
MNNMNDQIKIFILFVLLMGGGCVAQFTPDVSEEKDLLVVQGLLTDQQAPDTIKLSRSLPLGKVSEARPVTGCVVTISDNQGNDVTLNEPMPGIYVTPESFHGIIGRIYTLHITNNNRNYESFPMEMVPVPPIDSIYYEKTVIRPPFEDFNGIDGCQIYLDAHDPANQCQFYRWDFIETWMLTLLFPVENRTCWVSDKSRDINIKKTTALNESRITRIPVQYITNETDRLKLEYSILVNQYSLNEDEFNYWEKIHNIAVQVGGLYDIIPSTVPSNLFSIENPEEQVLGYFSVSAKSSKRIFIKGDFKGIVNQYPDCIKDTIAYVDPPGLNVSVWILDDEPYHIGPYRITTDKKGCADCTVRGTNIKPVWWVDEK